MAAPGTPIRLLALLAGAALLLGGCENEYIPQADTNEVPPAMDVDVGNTINVPDSTLGVSRRVMRPTISGDSAARSEGDRSPTDPLPGTPRQAPPQPRRP